MSNYDFHSLLESLEFEKLVCDIIKIRDGCIVETYREGHDSGIDGLFTDKSGKRTIIQAKRYKDFKSLFAHLKGIELSKVHKLNPERYILGVSFDFGPTQKEKIVQLFEGYILSKDDILSRSDMNRLLGEPKYNLTIQAHPKLWLPNLNIFKNMLQQIMHKASYKESNDELRDALDMAKVFVPTRIYHKALQIWSKNNVIILSGEPGVGKTSMAYLLALAYLQPDNIDGFVWANSISDVYNMDGENKNQVFILDDFWGSIFHEEHLGRNSENRLNKLIRRIVESNGKKRLILTTREYVLQQGLQKHPELRETLEQYSIICTMEEYGFDEKASIFFQHLYVSKLKYEYVSYLFNHYEGIIQDTNYSPRVLALYLNKNPDNDCSPEEYYDGLLTHFDNPGSFWESVFKELTPEAKIVAILLLISSTPMRVADMEFCYTKYSHILVNQAKIINLEDCIAELEKTIIKSFYNDEYDEIHLMFIMPAIQDFLFDFLKKNSNQYIPIILQCCSFFNQLQFLYEYLSPECSEKTTRLIEQECIAHYHDYPDCYIDYDGSWNWDTDMMENFREEKLKRFFYLLKNCERQKHPVLFQFLEIEINNYCQTMGCGNLVEQYADLHNLPDIISRCVQKGMSFNFQVKEIIKNFFEASFSVFHLQASKKFGSVFPIEFNEYYAINYPKMRKDLKKLIIEELVFLEDNDMDIEMDVLVDNIPEILVEFNLHYTKKFEDEIYSLCGRVPVSKNKGNKGNKDSVSDYVDAEEKAYKSIKEDANNWIMGPQEEYLEDEEISEYILNSNLITTLKSDLIQILNNASPHHIFNLLQTKESLDLLFATLSDLGNLFYKKESTISMFMLGHIVSDNQELMRDLISFCGEAFYLFMYKEEPLLRKSEFLNNEIYDHYLKNNPILHNVVFEHFILQDEQWIRFIHVHLFIFSHAFLWSISNNDELDELEEYYQELWGDNFNKIKLITYDFEPNLKPGIDIYYAEYGTYYFKCYEWERSMYKMFEELNPYHFNKYYVEEKLRNYLNKIGTDCDDNKILNHLSNCKFEIEFDKNGKQLSCMCCLDDELCLIENLDIAQVVDWCLQKN